MVNKTISIPYDLYKKLQDEANASKLITDLLDLHYGNSDKRSDEEIIDDVKRKIAEKEEAKVMKEQRIKELIATTKEIFDIELNEKQAQDYLADSKFENMRDYIGCLGLCIKEEQTESDTSCTS